MGGMLTNFFDELRVVERTPIIEQKSLYGLSALRDIWTGNVASDGSEFVLTAAAGGTQSAILDTAERGPYAPGQGLEPGMAFRPVTVPVGGQGSRHGYFDNLDGWYFQLDASGLKLGIRREGVDELQDFGGWTSAGLIQRSAFPRKFTYDPLNGYVYQTPLTWYGFGPAQYNFQLDQRALGRWMHLLGTIRPLRKTSVGQPHLPLRCEVYNAPGDDPYEVRISGRQINVIGKYDPIWRPTAIEREGVALVDTAWTPVLGIRRKAVYPYALSNIYDVMPLSDVNVRLAIGLNPDIANNTATDWTSIADIPPSETLLEANYNPGPNVASLSTLNPDWVQKARIDGGRIGGQASGHDASLVRTPFIETRPYVVYARSVAGAGTLNLTVNVRENY